MDDIVNSVPSWMFTAIIAVCILFIIGIIFARLYHRASAEQAFVRTGLGGQKVVMSGGAIVMPIFHEIIPINMNTLKLEVSRSTIDSLITKDRMRVDVVVAFFVRVKPSVEGIATAAQTLGQRTLSPEDLRMLVEDKFVDALRATAAQMTMHELQDTRENFVQGVQNTVAEDLSKNGLELESVSLTNFNQTSKEHFNPNNAFDAEGLTKLTQETERRRRERNEVEQDVEVAVREKNRDALSRKLEIEQQEAFMTLEQEQQVKTRTAEQNARIAAFEAERRREAEQTRILAERQIQETEIDREQAVRSRKVEAEREVRIKEIEQQQVTEIANQTKSIAIAAKSEQQSQAEARANLALAEAVSAQQNVETTRQTAEADRAKQVALIAAAQDAETKAVELTVRAKAEKEAAEMQAAAIVELAEATRKKGLAEAEAQRALNDAINVLSDEQTSLKFKLALLQALPAVIEKSVEPMKSIDGIKIIQVDGLNRGGAAGDDAGQLVGAVELQLEQHAEAVPQRPGQLPGAGGGPHQREVGQIDPDALGAGPLADDDIEGVIFKGRVEHLFHLPGQAVDLVDEEDVPLLQVGQQGGQVPRLFDGRARGDPDLHPHLVGDDAGEGGLAQAGRAVEQDMVHRLAPAAGRLKVDLQVLLDLFLSDIVLEMLRAEVVFLAVRRRQTRLHHFCTVKRLFLHGLSPPCHSAQRQPDDLFHRQRGVDLRDGHSRLALAVPQRDQRRDGLAAGRAAGRRRHAGQVLQRGFAGSPLGHLILQFQHDPLGQLGSHPAGGLERLVVPRRDGQVDPLRLHHAEDGQAHFGPHAGHPGQQPEAVLLLLGGKAVQADVVLGHIEDGVEGGLAPGAGQAGRHAGRALGPVAHPAAGEDDAVQRLFDDLPAQAINHTRSSLRSGPRRAPSGG